MFCMKCGKKIDDDSTFCPYCGGKVEVRAVMNTPISSDSGINNSLDKMISKKTIIGLSSCLVAVIVIIVMVKLLSGSFGKTLAEQLFLMSWEEMVDLDMKEFKSDLRDEGITYEQEDSNYSSSLYTKSVSSFMNYDCIFGYSNATYIEAYGIPSFDLPESSFIITFNTQEDYKDGKDDLLKYLNKNQSKECDVIKIGESDVDGYMYLLDVRKDNLEKYVDCYEETANEFFDTYDSNDDYLWIDDIEESSRNLEDKLEKIRDNISDYKVYKFCVIAFVDLDMIEDTLSGMIDLSKNDYYDYVCLMMNRYMFMTDEEFYKYMAQYNYDAVSKKDIDLDEVRKTIDVDLMDEKIQDSESDLRSIYFVENHGMDIKSDMNVNNDELKRIWYIKTFGWDNQAADFVDLSDYKGSTGVYCAVAFNYNTDDDTYFESDLDKAIFLSEKNYNPNTGESFVSEDEKRLYFLENYSYDTFSKKNVDAEVIEALFAYVNYSEEVLSDEEIYGYNLIYIDDNDVPECLVWTEDDNRVYVLSYKNGNIESVTTQMSSAYTHVSYTPKSGVFELGVFYGSAGLESDIFTLDDSFDWVLYADENRTFSWDEYDLVYTINGETVDESIYNENLKQYENFECTISVDTSGYGTDISETYGSILSAYDALRTTKYYANLPEIVEFELSDGILTVSSDDGSRFGWNGGEREYFSFSYPVSDDCSWECGYYAVDFVRDEYMDYSTVKECIESEQAQYKEGKEKYGDDFSVESPPGFDFIVVDGVIVKVYMLLP